MKSIKFLAALMVTGALALSGSMVAQQAFASDDKKTEKKAEVGEPGSMAPSFELKDLDGKTVKLSDFKGKVLVIEWYNPECPFIVKHHKTFPTFNNLHEEYKSRDVAFVAINSSAKGKQGHGIEMNKQKAAEFKLPFPVLIDESGEVGKAYGAKTTPHVFVIDADGKIAYNGAVDNNKSPSKAGDKNYVKMALDEVLAKKPVTTAKTDPYGCSVKYAK